jgi:hypothetical protein
VKESERIYFKWSKKKEYARWLYTADSEDLLKKMTAAAKPQFSDVKSQIPELVKTSHNDILNKTFQLFEFYQMSSKRQPDFAMLGRCLSLPKHRSIRLLNQFTWPPAP